MNIGQNQYIAPDCLPRPKNFSNYFCFSSSQALSSLTMGSLSVGVLAKLALAIVFALTISYTFTITASAEGTAGSVDVYLPFVSSVDVPQSQIGGSRNPNSFCEQANSKEIAIIEMVENAPGQQRPYIICNSILAQVARERARDMAVRGYFTHTNLDGIGPNALVRSAGYSLPSFYASSLDGNNIESIAGGYPTAQEAFDGWMESSGHRTQLLGEIDFYKNQVEVGVGYYYDANSDNKHYWVFLSAYEEVQ